MGIVFFYYIKLVPEICQHLAVISWMYSQAFRGWSPFLAINFTPLSVFITRYGGKTLQHEGKRTGLGMPENHT
jgi:hypothetical protein